jgi:uncharacterized membrane protein
MIKLTKEEFIEEINAELMGYEEISSEHIKQFMSTLNTYFDNKKGKKERISYKANSVVIHLKDECEIFDMADNYLSAIVNDEVQKYLDMFEL